MDSGGPKGHLSGGVWILLIPFLILGVLVVIASIATVVKFIVSLVRFIKADNDDRETKKKLALKAFGSALVAAVMLLCFILILFVFF